MKRFALACAALATIAIGLPSVASAEEFSVRVGGDRGMYRDGGDYRQAVSFVEREPNMATIGMIAVCTVVGTKIVGSAP